MHGRAYRALGPISRGAAFYLYYHSLDSGDTWTHGAHTVYTSMMHNLVLTQRPGDTRRHVPMGHRVFPRAGCTLQLQGVNEPHAKALRSGAVWCNFGSAHALSNDARKRNELGYAVSIRNGQHEQHLPRAGDRPRN
eukprot:5842053-Prymnesium_polylepis.1